MRVLKFLKNYGWQVNKRLIAWLATSEFTRTKTICATRLRSFTYFLDDNFFRNSLL